MTNTLALSADAAHAPDTSNSLTSRVLSLAYGSAIYALFLGTFLYVIGFVSGTFVPKHIDSGTAAPLTKALLVNGGFLTLFVVQHTIMARTAFKRWWTQIVPKQVERSTFVLATCLILIGLVWNWQPLPAVVWHIEGPAAIALWALSAAGWATVLVATMLINHFELFGLRQVVLHAFNREYEAPHFVERGLYKVVRHPLMTGFLLAFWSTPHMTVGHLFFAGMVTFYVLVGVKIEERTLLGEHGDTYRVYMRRVPGLVPRPR
jgi:protein-S-isoprenylcysteine O-methyltransferase Ste14